MNDLISRKALLKSIKNSTAVRAVKVLAQVFVETEPTIEAEPVKHGRWEHIGGDEWCCTNCGEVISTEGSWDKPTYKRCHECGAKMDGKDGGGNAQTD